MPLQFELLATNRGLDERGLRCVGGDRCSQSLLIEECASLCSFEGSAFFQYGKGDRVQDCFCAITGYQYPLTVNTYFDIYGIRDHTLEEIAIHRSEYGLLASDRSLVGALKGITRDRRGRISNVLLDECAKFCNFRGSVYFQYGKNVRSKECVCAIYGQRYPLSVDTHWDVYGFTGHTLELLEDTSLANTHNKTFAPRKERLMIYLLGALLFATWVILTLACCYRCRQKKARDLGSVSQSHPPAFDRVEVFSAAEERNVAKEIVVNASSESARLESTRYEVHRNNMLALRAHGVAEHCDAPGDMWNCTDLFVPDFHRPGPLMPTAPCAKRDESGKDWVVSDLSPPKQIPPRQTLSLGQAGSCLKQAQLRICTSPRQTPSAWNLSRRPETNIDTVRVVNTLDAVQVVNTLESDEKSTTDPSGMTDRSVPTIETFASSIIWDSDCPSDCCQRARLSDEDSIQSTALTGTSERPDEDLC